MDSSRPMDGVFSLGKLPEHSRVLKAIAERFDGSPQRPIGCFVSGSVARDDMDPQSDIDIGFVYADSGARDAEWDTRWEWDIAPWFHRFDADHIKPHFVIYLFNPDIKADISLYVEDDLPPVEGAPYRIVWDDSGVLGKWNEMIQAQSLPAPDWSQADHEDERFWAWSFYLYAHLKRGEYYGCARDFQMLMNIVETWTARLEGYSVFEPRWAERVYGQSAYIGCYGFPKPTFLSLKESLQTIVLRYGILRKFVTKRCAVEWKTEASGIRRIQDLISSL